MPIDNFDDMSDDDFMDALDNASYDIPEEQDENIEDTDQTVDDVESTGSEAETNEESDDDSQDTEQDEDNQDDESDGENSQVENEGEEEDVVTSDSDDEAENESDKKEKPVEINYEEEYKKISEEKAWFENFYKEATSEFIANGKKIKGFDDPKKIIQAQQIAAGYSDKMAEAKPYRKYMNTLKDKGILDDPDKFNLAMSLLDGDPEAIKKQIKDLNIDPFELDMDKIEYNPNNYVSSDIELALDDVMSSAQANGVEDQVQNIIAKDWDDDSVLELLNDPKNSSDLIEHISSGAYDIVQERISEKKRVDVNGTYGQKPKIEQYREAAMELEAEYVNYMQEQANQGVVPGTQQNQNKTPEVASRAEQEQYTKSVEKQKAKTNNARRKASSMSKKKRSSGSNNKKIDPLNDMNDDAFSEYMDSLIYS